MIDLKAVDSYGEDEDFSCDDPEAIGLMLDFMYLGDYAFRPEPVTTSTESEGDDPTIGSEGGVIGEPPHVWGSPGLKIQQRDRRVFRDQLESTKKGAFWVVQPENENPAGVPQPKGSLTMHTRLYALAAKYGIKSLKSVAIAKMHNARQGTWDREDFAKAIAVTFGSTQDGDRGMRAVIIQTILECSSNLVNDPIIEKAVNAVEGLPFELFKQQSNNSKR